MPYKWITEYDGFLSKRAKEFETKWNKAQVSPATNLSGFETLSILGEGSFGQVRLVRELATDKHYAAKLILKEHVVKTKQLDNTMNEKRVLQSVHHPFLVWLKWSRKDNDYLYLGLPLMHGGELFTYQRKVKRFDELQAKFYASQVFMALDYLHYMNLVYRDLKPENIMIDRKGYLKLTDFGFCKRLEGRTLTLCGTPEYLAPEVIESVPYGTCVDWWCLGILLYELVVGYSPFAPHNHNEVRMYKKITSVEYKVPSLVSAPLNSLIRSLLQKEIPKRLGCGKLGGKDIMVHEWFEDINWLAVLQQKVQPPYVPKLKNEQDVSNFEKHKDKKHEPKSKTDKYPELFADF